MDTDYTLDHDTPQTDGQSSRSGFSAPLLPGQYRHIELLSHLASYSELLVAVTGPEGSGKSVLAHALAAHREEPEDSLFIAADLMLGMPAILNAIAGHWNMPRLADDIVAAREAIRHTAEEQAAEGHSLLVIIDQAEQLDAETLNDIAHFALLAPQTIAFTLFGNTGFERSFRESPASAPLHILALEPLTLDDAALLIQQVYSPQQPLPISQDELLLIYQQSGGHPTAVLRAAEDFLLHGTEGPASAPENTADKPAGSRFPLTHILAITAVAAALLMSFLYRGGVDTAAPVVDSKPLPVPDPVVAPPAEPQDSGLTEKPDLSAFDQPSADVTVPEVASVPDYNYVAQKTVITPVEEKAETVAAAVAEDNVPAAEEPLAAVPRSEAEKALLAVREGFVIQLFGSYSAGSAEQFRGQWHDKVAGSLYQYETEHKGRPWFVVVAGVFNSRTEATAAVNAMPEELRRQSPWIRDISVVQQALK